MGLKRWERFFVAFKLPLKVFWTQLDIVLMQIVLLLFAHSDDHDSVEYLQADKKPAFTKAQLTHKKLLNNLLKYSYSLAGDGGY